MEQRWLREAVSRLPPLLGEWLDIPREAITTELPTDDGVDLILRAPSRRLLVQVKGTDNVANLERAQAQLTAYPHRSGADVEVMAVPFMGPKARAWAQDHRLSWMDLSGNADIRAGDLRIKLAGEPNKFAHSGRPSSAFTPTFSRVSRALLVDANRWWKQRELAAAVALPTGTVSKAVQRLVAEDLIAENEAGQIRARDPSLLLAAWAQRYEFRQHELRRYHAVGRSGPSILKDVAGKLADGPSRWAATGLSAAWMYTQFADFRINTFYLESFPTDPEALGLRPVDKGENVWLVVPRDEGVFYGADVGRDVRCVCPVQVYLDLLSHPERASEAATSLLRSPWLTWRT